MANRTNSSKAVKKESGDDGDDCVITGVSMAQEKKAKTSTTKGKARAKPEVDDVKKPIKKAKAEPSSSTKPKAAAKKATSSSTASKKRSSSASTSKKTVKAPPIKSSVTSSANKKKNSTPKKKAKKPEWIKGQPGYVLEPEKRDAVFRKKPSVKVMERVERVNSQRMFLLDRKKQTRSIRKGSYVSADSNATETTEEIVKEEFMISGSTGNVYTVTIDLKPRCDCPDWKFNGGDVCKHIIFVFSRVLGVPVESHVWYQKALLPSELEEIFANARPDPTHSNPSLTKAYLKAVGKSQDDDKDSKEEKKRRVPQQGDVCPICYEEFIEGKQDGLFFCESSCGNPLHQNCAKEWGISCKKSGQEVTCIYCRASISISKKGEGSSRKSIRDGYLNLASSINPERDNSVYNFFGLGSIFSR